MKTYELILTVLLSLLLHAGKQTAIVEAAYMWEVGVFDDSCSATCGDGFGYRSVHCIDDSTNARVHDSMCEGDDSVATPKPSSQQYCTSTTTCGVEIDNEEAEVCPKFELWLDLAFDYRQYYPTDDELSIAMDGMLSHVLQTISNRVVVDIVYLVSANNRKVRTRDYSTPVTQTTTKIALLPRRTPTYEGEKGCNATIATLTSVLDASLLPASTEYEKEFCEGCAIPGNFKSTKVGTFLVGYSQTPPAYHDDDDGMPGIIGFVDLIIGILSIGIIACIFGAIYNSLRKKSEDYADTTRRMSQANINTITDSSDGVGSANNMGMGLGFNGSSNINISGGESGSINGDGNKASAISSSVVSNYPAASPPCPVLPQGWERIYDDSTGRYYFWHEESETSQWEPPVAYVQ